MLSWCEVGEPGVDLITDVKYCGIRFRSRAIDRLRKFAVEINVCARPAPIPDYIKGRLGSYGLGNQYDYCSWFDAYH